MSEAEVSDRAFLPSVLTGFVGSGVLLIASFGLAGGILAPAANDNPFTSMLLLNSDERLSNIFHSDGNGLSYRDFATLSAIVTFYGIISVMPPFIFLVAKKGGYIKFFYTKSWDDTRFNNFYNLVQLDYIHGMGPIRRVHL
jgi:hypothetical protein